MTYTWHLVCLLLVSCGALARPGLDGERSSSLPPGFVYVDKVIPGLKLEMRYYTAHNFVGRRIDGYLQPKCLLTAEAAAALKKVQDELAPVGLGLKIFDAYRPQRAVDDFVQWAKDLNDVRMKDEFYPEVKKKNLFKEKYIATQSSHSRGSTVDLTIVALTGSAAGSGLDMGSGFDLFGPRSWPTSLAVPPAARAHRLLLQVLMKKHGFSPYPQEWWHFTLEDEPFPNTYFDFPIQ
jgi:D-alanyl-D-alanine dipeptidase